MTDLLQLLTRLSRHHVDFVIVGGFAAVAHGSGLVTQDIDICCDFSRGNLLRLHKAVADLHPVHRMTPQRLPLRLDSLRRSGMKNLYLDTDLGILDCLSSILGVGKFAAVRRRSVEVAIDVGLRCRVLSLDALIHAKEAMGRPRDKEAAIQLRAIRERAGSTRRGGRRVKKRNR